MPGSRRTFLRAAAACWAGGWLCREGAFNEVVAAPRFGNLPQRVIDTHTHFYDTRRPEGVPFPARDNKLLYRPVLPEHFLALEKPVPVEGTVVVEASDRLEDNQWILDLAADNPVIVGFVGRLAPGTPEFAGHLQRFAANRLFRGIRLRNDEFGPGLSEADYVRDLERVAERNLQVDVMRGPDMLADVVRMANAVPKLRIVIDHIANVAITGAEVDAKWAAAMHEAAALDNVYCKVSGLPENAARRGEPAPRDVEFYRPTLDVLFSEFGSNRLIYGSNWPVCERAADYATLLEIVLAYFTNKGQEAADNYFWRNGKQAYGLI